MKSPQRSLRPRITPALIISVLALVVAMGGTATASGLIGSSDIKKNAVKTKHIKKNAVKSKQIKNKTIRVADLSPAARGALAGEAGAVGPKGADGVSGYKIVANVKHGITEMGGTFVVAQCDAGQQAIGGGAYYTDSTRGYLSASGPVTATDAMPSTGAVATGWRARVFKHEPGSTASLHVHVICANVN